MAAIMIVSGHIVEYDDLLLKDDDKCILAARDKFVCPSNMMTRGDLNNKYLVFNKN